VQEIMFGMLGFAFGVISYAVLARRAGRGASTRMLVPLLFVTSTLFVALAIAGALLSLDEGVMALALSWCLGLAFLVANTAIETDITTQSLVLLLADAGTEGVTEEMLDRFIAEHPFRDSRLHGLLRDGLIERKGDRLMCRPGGRSFLNVLETYRRLIARREVTG